MRWLWIVLLFAACSEITPVDLRNQGRSSARSLTRELQQIHSVEELKRAQPKLRKHFLKIARLLAMANEYRTAHPGEEPLPPLEACDELFSELSRLYELPGACELIAASQEEAWALYTNQCLSPCGS